MKDNLEQLVRDKRTQFDDKTPDEKVWRKIAKDLEGKQNYIWLWKVAAIIFFAMSVLLALKVDFTSEPLMAKSTNAQQSEFEAVETFYFDMISEKKSLIYDFEERNKAIDQDFEQDLQKLDAMYQVLKEELVRNPSKKVVDALILNLLVRIDILNEQLQDLDTDDDVDEGSSSKEVNA
ncbi:hypothetical protein E1176_10315 [Fulvivirga sp. RKSG066]|uniref:hypothetical protein n=1 Tax=Fulvivirga aurantia TaxID=2529383 RepID=UPI0012BC919A|nr:hypothetical protein [Fulvivirga aurantia]MTI21413.1 hypothetical protein [Fulvivirga aurantia]